jgi:hypothetical protein
MKHILALGLVLVFAFGCGDKKSGAPDCTATGTACVDGADGCCTGFCEELTGSCARVPGSCVAANDSCSVGPDCCSLSCIDFKCSGDQCTSDSQSCGQDGECCSGICGSDDKCAPLNASCRTAGNTCGTNGECCSGFCKDNGSGVPTCNNAPSFCTQVGDTCVTDSECCGGACAIASGQALGTCRVVPSSGATGCTTTGEVCGAGADFDPATQELPTCGGECCSRACFPYGPTGVLICQPPSGCRPTGELCYEDSDCCGGPGQPDSGSNVMCQKAAGFNVGRCDNGNSCSPAGAICRLQSGSCNANANCCAGNVLQYNTCLQDALGIPRCAVAGCKLTDPGCDPGDCDPTGVAGMACASSADCCGLPCVAVPGSESFVCAAACQMTGSSCTSNTDCCSGLPCVIPGGATAGTCGMNQGCADYGQACDAQNLCCNGLPCSNGICQGIIL